MGLDGLEPLEIEERLHEARAGRITVVNGLDIDAQHASPFRPVIQHILEGLAQKHGLHVGMIEEFTDTVDHTFFERPVIEDRRIKEGRKQRILCRGATRLMQQAAPDRIDDRQLFGLTGLGTCDHEWSPRLQ